MSNRCDICNKLAIDTHKLVDINGNSLTACSYCLVHYDDFIDMNRTIYNSVVVTVNERNIE